MIMSDSASTAIRPALLIHSGMRVDPGIPFSPFGNGCLFSISHLKFP